MSQRFSPRRMLGAIGQIALRFPLLVLDTLAGTIIGVILLQKNWTDYTGNILMRTEMMLFLGFPFLFATALFAERRAWRAREKWLVDVILIAALAFYYNLLPHGADLFLQQDNIRFVIFVAAAIAAVAVVPKAEKARIMPLWHYNKTLFVRGLMAAIYAAALFIGLAIALKSIQFLFNVQIPGHVFLQTWVVVVGIVGTWLFLAGIPKQSEETPDAYDFPGIWRVLFTHILLPLLALFTLIIYAYVGKILVTRTWPEGGVAYWILAFTAAGTALFATTYPLQKQENYHWLARAFRILFILFLPLVIVLVEALRIRINEYGITVNRFFVGLYAAWLVPTALYFIASKKQNLRVIPISLALGLLIFSFGPWSAFAFSGRSQVARLEKQLTKYHILVDGKVKKTHDAIPPKDREAVFSSLRYLVETEGADVLQPWFDQDLQALGQGQHSGYDRALAIAALFDDHPYEGSTGSFSDGLYYFNAKPRIFVEDIRGYDMSLHITDRSLSEPDLLFDDAKSNTRVSLKENTLVIEKAGKTASISLQKKLDEIIATYGQAIDGRNVPSEEMVIEGADGNAKVKVYITMIIASDKDKKGARITDIDADVLVKFLK